MNKKKRISLSGWLFYSISIFILAVGFVGLFAKQFKFNIPYVTDVMIPIFDKYAVKVPGWGTTGAYTEVVSGQHWVFLILLGIAITIAIIGKQFSNFFLHLATQRRKKSKKRTKARIKRHSTQSKVRPTTSTSNNSEEKLVAEKPPESPEEPAGKHKNFADLTRGLNK